MATLGQGLFVCAPEFRGIQRWSSGFQPDAEPASSHSRHPYLDGRRIVSSPLQDFLLWHFVFRNIDIWDRYNIVHKSSGIFLGVDAIPGDKKHTRITLQADSSEAPIWYIRPLGSSNYLLRVVNRISKKKPMERALYLDLGNPEGAVDTFTASWQGTQAWALPRFAEETSQIWAILRDSKGKNGWTISTASRYVPAARLAVQSLSTETEITNQGTVAANDAVVALDPEASEASGQQLWDFRPVRNGLASGMFAR